MPTSRPAWTENQTLQAAQTVNASSSDTDDLDLDAAGFDEVLLIFAVTFNGSATGDYLIEIFTSADGGSNDSTVPIIAQPVECDPGQTVRVSVSVAGVPYIAVKRTNEDGSYSITNETVMYAGRKWSHT